MKKLVIILFCSIAYTWLEYHKVMANDIKPPQPNDVHIAPNSVGVPLGKILLVRKGSSYCALKFTKFWTENESKVGTLFVAAGSDEYALYESYYQGDKTGDFSKRNVESKKAKLSSLKPRGIGRLAFSFGNRQIKCGNIKLEWFSTGSLFFYREGRKESDFGIELAPTKWSDISQVNVFDSRLGWYRYDKNRERLSIPIDKLWEDKKEGSSWN